MEENSKEKLVELELNEEESNQKSESEGEFSDIPSMQAFQSSPTQLSLRSLLVGLFVGSLMCFANMYFGLQTGWVTMGSLQSTILGFGIFRILAKKFDLFRNFGPTENVVLQTTAVATATMPLAAGFVGIIPALKMLDSQENPTGVNLNLTWWELILWTFSVAFFGVFFAVPLRKQTILKEKLKFPSGSATAQMIEVLHKKSSENEPSLIYHPDDQNWKYKWKVLWITFGFSSFFSILSYFIPILYNLPIFTWIGLSTLTAWNWTITPSLSYVGQGMIMGTRSGFSMGLGAIFGWAILGPIAKSAGWASGPINNWKTGAKGWILWVSLTIMIAESLTSLTILIIKTLRVQYIIRKYKAKIPEEVDPAPIHQLVPAKWWIAGLIASTVVVICVASPMFNMPVYEPLVAVIVALLVSTLAVRALGETDLNPVSGVGKLSQIVFAVVAPGNIIANIIAGAIAEAGAQQAGDLMQDLKTGHLLKASPRAQFFGQLFGSFFSVFLAVCAYQLYTTAYEIPSALFPVPTAYIWIDMARLMNTGLDAPNAVWFCVLGAIFAATIPILPLLFPKIAPYLPSGVAFAIGMYLTPNFVIPRFVGSLIQFWWQRKNPKSFDENMIVVASGFVLGEGIISIFNAILKASGVPVLTCSGCVPGLCSGCP